MQKRHKITITLTDAEIEQVIDEMVADTYAWAVKNRPRLVHLAAYAKKGRIRTKNTRRIIREFLREG